MIRIYTWHSSSRGIVTFKNICILRNFFPISITGSRLNANCSGQTLIPTYFTLRMCVCACVLFDRNRYFIESINTREYFLKLKREKDGRGIIRKRYIFKYIPFFWFLFFQKNLEETFQSFLNCWKKYLKCKVKLMKLENSRILRQIIFGYYRVTFLCFYVVVRSKFIEENRRLRTRCKDSSCKQLEEGNCARVVVFYEKSFSYFIDIW